MVAAPDHRDRTQPSTLRSARLLRIAMSVNQAGAGYLAGFSRTIVFRRA